MIDYTTIIHCLSCDSFQAVTPPFYGNCIFPTLRSGAAFGALVEGKL